MLVRGWFSPMGTLSYSDCLIKEWWRYDGNDATFTLVLFLLLVSLLSIYFLKKELRHSVITLLNLLFDSIWVDLRWRKEIIDYVICVITLRTLYSMNVVTRIQLVLADWHQWKGFNPFNFGQGTLSFCHHSRSVIRIYERSVSEQSAVIRRNDRIMFDWFVSEISALSQSGRHIVAPSLDYG